MRLLGKQLKVALLMKLFCFLFLVAEFALVVYALDLILKDFAILLRHFLIVLVQKIGTQLTGCRCRSRPQGLPNIRIGGSR